MAKKPEDKRISSHDLHYNIAVRYEQREIPMPEQLTHNKMCGYIREVCQLPKFVKGNCYEDADDSLILDMSACFAVISTLDYAVCSDLAIELSVAFNSWEYVQQRMVGLVGLDVMLGHTLNTAIQAGQEEILNTKYL